MNINKLDLICFNNVYGLHFYTQVLNSWLHHPLGSPILVFSLLNQWNKNVLVCVHACVQYIFPFLCFCFVHFYLLYIFALNFNATGLWLLSVHYYKQYKGACLSHSLVLLKPFCSHWEVSQNSDTKLVLLKSSARIVDLKINSYNLRRKFFPWDLDVIPLKTNLDITVLVNVMIKIVLCWASYRSHDMQLGIIV